MLFAARKEIPLKSPLLEKRNSENVVFKLFLANHFFAVRKFYFFDGLQTLRKIFYRCIYH